MGNDKGVPGEGIRQPFSWRWNGQSREVGVWRGGTLVWNRERANRAARRCTATKRGAQAAERSAGGIEQQCRRAGCGAHARQRRVAASGADGVAAEPRTDVGGEIELPGGAGADAAHAQAA